MAVARAEPARLDLDVGGRISSAGSRCAAALEQPPCALGEARHAARVAADIRSLTWTATTRVPSPRERAARARARPRCRPTERHDARAGAGSSPRSTCPASSRAGLDVPERPERRRPADRQEVRAAASRRQSVLAASISGKRRDRPERAVRAVDRARPDRPIRASWRSTCASSGWSTSASTVRMPCSRAYSAVARPWLVASAPTVKIVRRRLRSASASTHSSLRALLPPQAPPKTPSSFSQISPAPGAARAPRAAARASARRPSAMSGSDVGSAGKRA